MPGKQVTELDALPSFTDTSLLPVHNGAGLKKGSLSQLANYLGTKFSNPNLLINPDFKINQRGATSYEQQGYSVDRWKIWNVTVTPSTSGGITVKNDKYTDTGTFIQILENATEGDSTLSCYVTSVTGTVTMFADDNTQVVLKQGLNVVHTSNSTKNFSIFLNRGTSITLKWVKLEQGKVATSFIAPNPAEELEKCLRFSRYIPTIYCVPLRRYIGDISNARAYYLPLGCVFETKLRAKGTISLKGGVFDSTSSSLGGIKEIDYSQDEIRQVIMPQEMTPWTLILKKVFIDAEIY
nr:MAG TPA: tail fiber protein [Caudoviricetes sp.]